MNVFNFWRMAGCLFLTVSIPAMANEVSREDWMNGMATALPAYFCKSDQYFRQCFNVTQIECEEMALSTTRICLAQNKNKLPAKLAMPDDGRQWGTVIGRCAGSAYGVSLHKKAVNSSKCNNADNWK